MSSWERFVSTAGGRPAIVALGAIYVGFAVGLASVEIAGGTPISNALIFSFFIGGPGMILIYGGYRLPRTTILPKFYPTVTKWCLGAIAALSGLLTLYHLQPAGGIDNFARAIFVITAFVVVPAFAGGINAARAKTHAFDLERALDNLQKTERIADVGGWEIDPATREVSWSDHLFELLEVSSDEEPALDQALDIYHEDDRPVIEGAVDAALDSGDPFDVEARFRTASGEVRWVRVQGNPEPVDDEVVSLRGAVQDITDRKERELELKQRANQQQVVANLGKIALVTDDLDEFMHEASRRVVDALDSEYCEVLDLDAESEELRLRQGVGWEAGLVGAATVSAVEADSQAAYTLANNHPIIVEDLGTETRFSGPELLTNRNVRSGITTIIGPFYEPWGVLGTHDTDRRSFADEDVTFVQSVANVLADAIERHQYQQKLERLVADLEESNDRLEQFAHAASHDLQEPLRMVSSYLQLIEHRYEDEVDEEGREFLEFAIDGADRMRAMIDGLLRYSRVETQGEPFEPIDLNEVVADASSDLSVRITESDAEVDIEALPHVEGDADQLRQVFQNLLTNAIQYSGDEPPRIQISVERNHAMWKVSVRDQGVGIDPAQQERIFEIFHRMHTHDGVAGSGIGLALCERIVKRHGGEIWVDSEPGEGSTFSFTLPTAGD